MSTQLVDIKMLRIVAITVIAVLSTAGASDNSVHIYNTYPDLRITSSTLRWIGEQGGVRPDSAVVATVNIVPAEGGGEAEAVDAVKERPVHVCRARHNGLWVPGQLPSNATQCQMSLLGKVFSYGHYEVLENVESGARLSWVQWGRYNPVLQKGAVAGGDSYVARRRVTEGQEEVKVLGPRHFVGRFDPKEGIGRIIVIEGVGVDAEEKDYHEGEILVETEPISYELNSLKFQEHRRKEVGTVRELGMVTLRNDQEQGKAKVDTVVAYDAVYSMYWGQGRSMLKGLPTNIRMADNVIEEVKWGIPSTEDRRDVYRVEAVLEAGTAVNVTVWGNQTESEVPYTGRLLAVYEDLQTRARAITGVLQQQSMKDLKAVFGPVYWLHNNTMVPTTTTTTTTTTTSTTTTTTTTTTTLRPRETVNDNSVQGDDTEAVAYHKNISQSSVVPDPSPSTSHSIHSCIVLLVTLVLVLRIT